MKQSPTQLMAKIAQRLKIPFDRLPADIISQTIRKHEAENQLHEAKVGEELRELAIQIKESIESGQRITLGTRLKSELLWVKKSRDVRDSFKPVLSQRINGAL